MVQESCPEVMAVPFLYHLAVPLLIPGLGWRHCHGGYLIDRCFPLT